MAYRTFGGPGGISVKKTMGFIPLKTKKRVVKKVTPKKPKPKPFIKYKKGGKVIGTSKYRQGEGKLGVKERFKRDKK